MTESTATACVIHTGGCHCGGVRFEVRAPSVVRVSECNCSVCFKAGYLGLIVPESHFSLRQGEALLSTYQFNKHIARHTFCARCGVKSFYRPRSHPDGVNVNIRCLDAGTLDEVIVTVTDGQNWEAHYTDGDNNPYLNFPDHS